MKKYKSVLVYTIIHIVYLLLISIINYLGIPMSITNIINMILFVIMYFLIGIKIGKKTQSKGYINGLKYGFALLLLTYLISLFYTTTFTLFRILYYLVLLSSCVIGSVIGINKKRK